MRTETAVAGKSFGRTLAPNFQLDLPGIQGA